MTPLRQRMLEDLRVRNYSPRTQAIYIQHVARFAGHFGRSPDQLGKEEIRSYLVQLVEARRVSWTWFNQTVCALRFFYRVTLGRGDIVPNIPYPRTPKKLPTVLSAAEVVRLLDAVENGKHRAVLSTIRAREQQDELFIGAGLGNPSAVREELAGISATIAKALEAAGDLNNPDDVAKTLKEKLNALYLGGDNGSIQ